MVFVTAETGKIRDHNPLFAEFKLLNANLKSEPDK